MISATMTANRNRVRIIAGKWRSRLVKFAPAAELRPTPDRVRETLFNWLGQHLDDLACIDLFAGSGALGFEALSRGAARVVMVERDRAVAQQLRERAARAPRGALARLAPGARRGGTLCALRARAMTITRAVYPGTFDPITNGHEDLIQRASRLFDEVIVGVAHSQAKRPFFSMDERVELARDVLAGYKNVTISG